MISEILLVDDDSEHLEMMERCCKRMGITATSTFDGRKAIECLKRKPFSVVISDIHMADIDGIGVLRFIKEQALDTDVILVTGYSDTYSFTDVIKEGATDYLEKPFVQDALEAKLNRVFRERQEISRRKKIEEELRHKTAELWQSHQSLEKKIAQRTSDLFNAKAELELVFESVPDGIISVDNSMHILHKNNRCMTKLTMVIGEIFVEGTNQLQQECHRILSTTLQKGMAINDYRVEFYKGEADHEAFLLSSSGLFSDDRHLKGALLVIHDITRVVILENQVQERRCAARIIGKSKKMQEIFQRIRQIASVDTTVLIAGDSGVGKELIVDTLHAQGDRADKPLIKVNCSALPEALLESELFGHVKGAFTGAVKERAGRIQRAEGGILFLDEIGDISPRIQVKLLRFLEQKEYEKVGESQKRVADVRVFAATNANLKDKVKDGSFREDLYYRLKVMLISCPSLVDRQDDIPLLIEHFMNLFNEKFKKQIARVSPEALVVLQSYEWPGNIREFKHAFEHAFLLCDGLTLELKHFPLDLTVNPPAASPDAGQPARTITRESLLEKLNQTRWHRTKTAKLLNISRGTLYNKLKQFGLDESSHRL